MKVIDLTGKKFGHLTAIRKSESHRTHGGNLVTMWEVRCDCGNLKQSSLSNLKTGRVLTCTSPSCPHVSVKWNADNGHKDAAVRQVLGWYRARAKRKKLEFQLTLADVDALMS